LQRVFVGDRISTTRRHQVGLVKIKGGMLARENYSYKKYQKELVKKKKREEKKQRKMDKKNMETKEDSGQAPN